MFCSTIMKKLTHFFNMNDKKSSNNVPLKDVLMYALCIIQSLLKSMYKCKQR